MINHQSTTHQQWRFAVSTTLQPRIVTHRSQWNCDSVKITCDILTCATPCGIMKNKPVNFLSNARSRLASCRAMPNYVEPLPIRSAIVIMMYALATTQSSVKMSGLSQYPCCVGQLATNNGTRDNKRCIQCLTYKNMFGAIVADPLNRWSVLVSLNYAIMHMFVSQSFTGCPDSTHVRVFGLFRHSTNQQQTNSNLEIRRRLFHAPRKVS